MLEDDPNSSSGDLAAWLHILTGYLSPTQWAQLAFAICAVIAVGSCLTAIADIRGGMGRLKKLQCRWKLDSLQPYNERKRWVCSACGGISFTGGRKPPVTCRRYDPRSKY